MCNACGNLCCGSDMFGGCGCEHCGFEECWSDDEEFDTDDDYSEPSVGECVTTQDTTPPELKAVLAEALARHAGKHAIDN